MGRIIDKVQNKISLADLLALQVSTRRTQTEQTTIARV